MEVLLWGLFLLFVGLMGTGLWGANQVGEPPSMPGGDVGNAVNDGCGCVIILLVLIVGALFTAFPFMAR